MDSIITEDVVKLFDEASEGMARKCWNLMKDLWLNWSHLGVEQEMKIKNINKLLAIEDDLHREVISETKNKVTVMQGEIEKLKEETEVLSKVLSFDITIPDWDQDNLLCDYKRQLEERISGYREQVKRRRLEMERLREWQRDLTEKLGVTMEELQKLKLKDPLPSEEELEKVKEHLNILQLERDNRAVLFLNTQLELKDIMDKLQIKPQNKFEHIVVTSLSVDFKLTDLNMVRLAKLLQKFREKYEQTNNRVLELRERLTKLWECLEEDQIYRESFLQSHQGCHAGTETALRMEIQRCDQIKRQKIQIFVANVRTKIKLMWDACMYSAREREEFVHYYQDIFSEDILTIHELYLERITKFYNDHKQIFELIATRKDLWAKMTELEARATDPGRYNNRGGQLLKEEKERKAIDTKLPKIEEKLCELVTKYEAVTGNTFTLDGKPLLQYIKDEWETRKTERHNKLSARKQALTSGTPALFRSLATSPLGKRNRTAAHLLNTGDNNRRVSGRLAVRAIVEGAAATSKRKLDYDNSKRTPKVTVSGSILKHKRASHGKRRSSGRRSTLSTQSSSAVSHDEARQRDPLMETALLTTYTENINANQISRSSLATAHKGPESMKVLTIAFETIEETPLDTPSKKTPKTPSLMTPKAGKENYRKDITTPKSNIYTPIRLTRAALKQNNEGFATPRAPLSASKGNLHRQNTPTNNEGFATPRAPLSASKGNLHRQNTPTNNEGFATPRAPLSASKGNLHRQNTPTNLQRKNTPKSTLIRSPII